MPRDGSGTYTLPGGINPVISGTTIDVAWANPTMDDVATALTDSLSRTGSGGMLAPFLNADGAVGAPGIAWVNEPSMGIYRPGANEMRFVISGIDRFRTIVDPDNPAQVWVDSDSTWRNVLNIFSPYTIIGDWTWEGRVVTDDSTVTRAGFQIPLGVAPTVPVDGDMWLTALGIFARVNGVSENLTGSDAVGPSTDSTRILKGDGSGGWVDAGSRVTISVGNDLELDDALILKSGADQVAMFIGGGVCQLNSSGGTIFYFSTDEDWRFGGSVFIQERGSPAAQVGTFGQLWVEDHVVGTNPNILNFEDDAGNNYRLGGVQRRATLLDQTVNNSTVYVNLTNMVNFNIAPARRYKCKATLFWSSTTVADIKVRMSYTQTPEDQGFAMWSSTSAVSTVETDLDLDAFADINPTTMETGTSCLLIEFCFESHATLVGTLALQFAQNVASAVNTTILQPSFFEISENDNIS